MSKQPVKTVENFFTSTNISWLRDRTVFLTRHGSHAYGLNRPTSDEDFKGVAIPPREYFLGYANRFEQSQTNEPDLVIYDVRKFFALAAECNPNIIEVLWTDPSDHVILTPAAEILIENRAAFLSKKARYTFSGYAIAQLKRINIHYKWLKDPPKEAPKREDFGLLPGDRYGDLRDQIGAALAMIQREVATWDDLAWTTLDEAAKIGLKAKISDFLARAQVSREDVFIHTGRQLGFDDNFLAMLQREKEYRAKKQEWENYQGWLAKRNKARSELESKFGYDTKHAMHLVRLLRMCREILETGKVFVKRIADRDELLAIRDGAWTYETLIEWAAAQDATMEDLYARSPLPHAPNVKVLDALCIRLVEGMR